MKIKILGAHMFESDTTRLSSILIDEVMAIDAGGLTSSLAFEQQEKIDHILLTHGHYDHIRDVPAIALKNQHRTINVHSIQPALDILTTHLINGTVYPDFTRWPENAPALKLFAVEKNASFSIDSYSIKAVEVSHAIPAVGYQVTDSNGDCIFFSGDTGPGLTSCWEQIEPHTLIIETALSNKSADIAPKPGHLCPLLLEKELSSFQTVKGYLPKVILTHMNSDVEDEIQNEVTQVADRLGADISLAYEGMEITG